MGTITGGSWTYSGDPRVDDKDMVRFLILDTDGANQMFSDEEILAALQLEGGVYYAAAAVCRSFGTSKTLVDKKVGDLELRGNAQVLEYRALAADLRRRGALGAVPFAGGISIAGKQAERSDTDRVQPSFTKGSMDDPNNPQPILAGVPSSTLGSA